MVPTSQHLVVMDVPGIKKYVFGTNRLAEIRGASALLDRLNRSETETRLKELLGESSVTTVFANGGSAQFIIEATRDRLTDALNHIKKLFAERSARGVRLVYGCAEYGENTYNEALSEAFLKLNEDKEENGVVASSPVHTGFIRECASCSEMASEIFPYAEEDLILCEVCHTKLSEGIAGKRHGHWQDFASYLLSQGLTEEQIGQARPDDFEQIAQRCEARPGYTAVVYADGNAMGKIVKSIKTKGQFKLFSETVDTSIREACHESIWAKCGLSQDGIVPADILLLGGDDLLVYTKADAAFPLAIDVAERFSRKTKSRFEQAEGTEEGSFFLKRLNGEGLTLSLGIAYGKSATPFSIMLDQAEELLKSAKRSGAQAASAEGDGHHTPAYIDYHVAPNYNQVRVEDCRRRHLQFAAGHTDIRLYQKPYSLDDARRLLGHAEKLSVLPRSRLRALAEAVGSASYTGWMGSTLDCLKLYGRTRKQEHREALFAALKEFNCASNELPWKREGASLCTVLLDLIEITDFVTRKSGD